MCVGGVPFEAGALGVLELELQEVGSRRYGYWGSNSLPRQ